MAALPGIKYDDGSGAYVSNCFPVRSINSIGEEGSGAWLVEHRAEQRKQFKALLCAKPRTFEEIRQERRKAERNGTSIVLPPTLALEETDEEVVTGKILDGFFLMKLFCVDDPSDLCSINISGQRLSEVKEEDLGLFNNVAYVNAAENYLTIDQFKRFVTIRELELPLNGIQGIEIRPNTFPNLEMLDVSYNNLTPKDILPLGVLPQLKVLHLTGNGLDSLPVDLAGPVTLSSDTDRDGRFRKLEILLLDDNCFSNVDVFAALAGLRNLKHLNLSRNLIYAIPQLVLVRGQHVPTELTDKHPSKPGSSRKSQSSSRKSRHAPSQPVESMAAPPQPVEEPHRAVTPEHAQEDLNESFLAADITADLQLSELNLNDIDAKVEEQIVQEELDKEAEVSTDNLTPVRMPFPQLRYLNVAYNNVEEEEHLLAVSTWPMLTELVIHDNALTTHCSHMPPLLQMFLTDQLGIHVQRKRDSPIARPSIDIPQKPERKVSTQVERVPKISIEELLALESGTPFFKHGRRHSLEEARPSKDRLPPISLAPITGEERLTVAEHNEAVDDDGNTNEAFFMTQPLMDDPVCSPPACDDVTIHKTNPPERKKRKEKKVAEGAYKGYELLLNIDESTLDPDIPIPKDLHGNVRALRYMLDHPLVFRDNTIHLEKRQKPFEPYRRRGMSLSPQKSMRADQIDEMLARLRDRQCVKEAPLDKVLSHPRKYRKDFGNARQLLSEVQRKFNAVRENSMNDARADMREIVTETIRGIELQLNEPPAAS